MNVTYRPHTTDLIQPLKSEELLPPISRWTFLGSWFLVGTIGITVGLSSVMRYNVAVRASAVVRPSGELRVVQAEMDGTIQQIQAQENQMVRQGDVIAVLDDNKLQTQKSQIQNSIQQNQVQLIQLDAQIRLVNSQVLAESQALAREIAATQAEMARHQHDYQERRDTAQADFEEAQVTLRLAQDQLNRYQPLAAAGAIAQSQLKERESAVEMASARLERVRAVLNPSQANMAIAQQQIAQQRAKGAATVASLHREQKTLLQRQSEIQNQILREQKELEQVEQNLQASMIRATSDGIVFQSSLLNPGQVVRTGDNIVQIAPTHAPLIIKASVPNQDIDKVAVGQSAQIRVNACPYTDYGTLRGTVLSVAPDVGSSQNTSTASSSQGASSQSNARTFQAIIQIEDTVLSKGNRECQVQTGMDAIANIISRDETFLRFVLRKLRLFTNL